MKKIQILGMGCPKCQRLTANAEEAAQAAGIEYTIEKIMDFKEIVRLGVMLTPALAIDGKVLAAGRILTVDQIRQALES